MLTDEELYEGFAKEEILEIKQEVNEKFYKTFAEMYKGLGDMYTTDARFASFYDKHARFSQILKRRYALLC